MQKVGNLILLSASDLVGHLNCRHLTGLDIAVATGALEKPKVWDSLLQLLWERGARHEPYTSELFYEGRLHPRPGLEFQAIRSPGRVSGTGLRYVAVPTEGNQSSSPEEAVCVRNLVDEILASGTTWIDKHGVEQAVTLHRRTLQRTGVRAPGSHPRSTHRDRRQVSGPGSTSRHLLDDDLKLRRRTTRDGISLQPQPA